MEKQQSSSSSKLLQALGNSFAHVESAGVGQFSTVDILHTSTGYVVAQQLPVETSRQLRMLDVFTESLHISAVGNERTIPVDRIGTTPDGVVFWISKPLAIKPIHTAQFIIDKGETLGASETAHIGLEICAVLSSLHHQGNTHGGITPASIILAGQQIFIADIALESALRRCGLQTAQLPVALQSQRMSPERLVSGQPSIQDDIYSLGITLYELTTGKPPFGGRTTTMVMASVLTDEGISPDRPGKEPGFIAHAILRAIEKDPADRWTTALQFATALRRSSNGSSQQDFPAKQQGCLSPLLVATRAYIRDFLGRKSID